MKSRTRKPNRTAKEMTMNAFVSTLYRDLTCAAAAVVISLIVAGGFLQSTATAPAASAGTTASQARQA
jgi:hypothetical protein